MAVEFSLDFSLIPVDSCIFVLFPLFCVSRFLSLEEGTISLIFSFGWVVSLIFNLVLFNSLIFSLGDRVTDSEVGGASLGEVLGDSLIPFTLDGDLTPLEAEREMWETEGAFWSGELLREGLLMSALWAILTPSVV